MLPFEIGVSLFKISVSHNIETGRNVNTSKVVFYAFSGGYLEKYSLRMSV
jgi:hypothetical protein